jgi:hypothetical protein
MVYRASRFSMRVVATMSFLLSALLLLPARASAEPGVGDVFVSVEAGGGLIFLDGATTGIVAPGVVRGVSPGAHTLRVDDGCRTATAGVTVRVNAVERVTLALEPGAGTVSIQATPPETVVTENGKELGTGTFGPVPLACGSHTLVGSATGRQTATYTVEVPLRGHADVRLDLPVAALGSIAITPTPLEAQVFVDGATKGAGPMTVDNLTPGVHTVSARLDGYVNAEQQVTVVAYQIVRSSIELAVKPPPVSLGKRLGFDRVRWGRVAVDLGVSAAAVGLGVVAYLQYDRAAQNYTTYSGLTYADDPEGYYASEVAGPRTLAYALTGASGAAAVTSGVLWATTKPKPAASMSVGAPSGASAPSGSSAPSGASAPSGSSAPAAPSMPAAPAPGLQLLVAPSPFGVVVSGRF